MARGPLSKLPRAFFILLNFIFLRSCFPVIPGRTEPFSNKIPCPLNFHHSALFWSPSEIIASEHQRIMFRQLGVLVLLTLSHPCRTEDRGWVVRSELVCWFSPAGLVITQSHVSHSVQTSTEREQSEGGRETVKEGGRTKKRGGGWRFVIHVYGIQCAHLHSHSHKYAC